MANNSRSSETNSHGSEWSEIFRRWSERAQKAKLKEFLAYLRDYCNVTPGEAFTQEDWDELCEITNTPPDEAEELLMESAWP